MLFGKHVVVKNIFTTVDDVDVFLVGIWPQGGDFLIFLTTKTWKLTCFLKGFFNQGICFFL